MKRLIKYRPFLENYHKLPLNIKTIINKNIDKDLGNFICEICFNILKGNVSLNTNHKRRIKRMKNTLYKLVSKKSKIKSKVNFLRQKGGGILGILASIIAPLIATFIK